VHVPGNEGDEDLEDEALRSRLLVAALAEGIEKLGEFGSGFAGDVDTIVIEERFAGFGQEEGEGAGADRLGRSCRRDRRVAD